MLPTQDQKLSAKEATQKHTFKFDMMNNTRGVIQESFKGIQLRVNK